MAERITKEIILEKAINTYTKCFNISNENKKYECLVDTCTKSLADQASAIKHLKRHHQDIVRAVDGIKNKNQTDKDESIHIHAETNPRKIWNAILQIIIFSAIPFAFVNSKGFRYLIKPYVDAFQKVGIKFTVDELNVQAEIDKKANQVKEQMNRLE